MQRLKSFFGCFLLVLVCSVLSAAQTGSIGGTVTDSAGAVVQGAEVTVRNLASNASRTVTTGAVGTYNVTLLPVGIYEVAIKKEHFKTLHVPSVQLTVAQAMTVDARLELGPVSEQVQVNAARDQDVDLESSQISNLVDQKQIQDLPLITRNPYNLILLSPGAAQTNALGGITVNGARERNNNFLLDGVDNNDTSVPGIIGGVLSANPDSTQEFRVITNNYNAEFGRNTGAIVDVVTKSGTNAFHGDAYEFGRWNGFGGARDWFNPASQGPVNHYVRNQFGYSVGGPIRKDKTFFFFNQEFHRYVTTLTNASVVPTAAFKTGVFTYVDPNGNSVPVDLTPNSAQNMYGLPLDPTMAELLSLYPNPTVPNGDGFSGTLFFPSVSRENTADSVLRIDHRINNNQTLSLRYGYDHFSDPNPFHYDILPGGIGGFSEKAISEGLSANLTSVIRPNLLNTFSFGWNHIYSTYNCSGLNVLDSVSPLDQFGRGRDYVMDPFSSFGCAQLVSDGQYRKTGTVSYSEGISWVRGVHTLKFGFDFRNVGENGPSNFFSRRQAYTNSADFGGPDLVDVPNATVSLQDAASALYGFVFEDLYAEYFDKNGVRQSTDSKFFRQHEMDFYGQDDWKMWPNLTLTLGLRYQFEGVPYEENANFSNLFTDPSSFPVVFSLVGPGTGNQLYQNDYSEIEPRVGFSWDPWRDGKTSVRGAFGIFHDRVFGNLFNNARGNPPFEQDYFQIPFETVNDFFGSGAFPAVPPQTVPSASVPDGLGIPATIIDPHFRPTVSNNWNFGIQRELPGRNTIDLSYVGSHATHVPRVLDGNPPDPALVDQLVAYCSDPTNAYGCLPSDVALSNLYFGAGFTLPFNAVTQNALYQPNYERSVGRSNYNAMQVKFTHRLQYGLEVQGAYTWSHALDDSNDPLAQAAGNRGYPRNSRNLAEEYGNSDNDIRHTAVISYVWGLPVGRGKNYLNSGRLGRILAGIQLSGITTLQSGHPFDVFSPTDMERTGVIGRADLVGNPFAPGTNPNAAAGKVYFTNVDALSARVDPVTGLGPLYTGPGSVGRNHFYGPGYVDFDLALSKRLRLTERFGLDARIEAFNIFNHPHFSNPGADAQRLGNLVGSPLFGIINSTVSQPDGTTSARQLQVAVKVRF
jgi:Carboxypeptidase regulatory-like domain